MLARRRVLLSRKKIRDTSLCNRRERGIVWSVRRGVVFIIKILALLKKSFQQQIVYISASFGSIPRPHNS